MHAIQQSEVQDLVLNSDGIDARQLVLSGQGISGVSTALLAEQILARRKAREKLPTYFQTRGVVYPPSQNLEQSSSELTADFKAGILQKELGKTPFPIVDLTGGFGVDALAFARQLSKIVHVEAEHWLQEIASLSHHALGIWNIEYVSGDASSYIRSFNGPAAAIYVDPSRRSGGKKVVAFHDCSPDVITLMPVLFEKSGLVLIKASPLLDVKAGISALPNVSKVFVVSVKNECKEVLFLLERGFNGEPEISAANLDTLHRDFTFRYSLESAADVTFSEPGPFLYEPNSSILKAGAFRSIALEFQLRKVHMNTHLYTSDRIIDNFPGRVFKVKGVVSGSKGMRSWFPDLKASVLVRNFPTSADTLKKQLKFGESDTAYLIATTSLKGKQLLAAERLR